MEWWILYHDQKKNEMQAMHLRIQAKKQTSPTSYGDINQKNRNGYQIDLLIDAAVADKAIPLYCFYNRYFAGTSKNEVENETWKYAHASDIASTRNSKGEINDHYKKLDVFTTSMHSLATIAEKHPIKILQDFIKGNASVDGINYRHNDLPEYILDKLVTNELTTHPFFQLNPWFANSVSKSKLTRRKKKSDTFYSSILGTPTLFKFLKEVMTGLRSWLKDIFGFGVKNLPVIITVSKEPIFSEYD
ncbi:hypothetical protein NV381_20255 [Paenibacillus sp. N5-1-1-5]|uniref:Uncharacterized protein n=1 Tax=Paenibacillus radicis (ex Xue et al. 2023) TaxID=2972489 RepID=A0ABT1YK09_9BACL|nr:hypothetical protein [Paenibacillus radicis (ex Xue et al. 2023)]